MKIRILLLMTLLALVNLPIYSVIKKGESKYNPAKKSDKDKLKSNCCDINADHENKVRIQRVCIENGITSIELKFLQRQSVCTILENLTLRDNAGKKYNPLSYSGINKCPDSQSVNPGDIFYWNFEKFDSNVKNFSLSEAEIEDSTLNAWTWKNISISHCKF